ncbi:MAG: hypothetical protein QXJ48_04690 [Candidatus Korarchaeum sp.]
MGGKSSAYLLNALKQYFGEEKGERIADILGRSGIRCFDDLSSDVPDALVELMEVSRSEFNRFLEEYGPQAIAKLKERLEELSSRIRELETQIGWAKERVQQSIGARASMNAAFMRELEVVMSMISSMISSIQLCCEREKPLDPRKVEIYHKSIREAAERLRRASSIDREFSERLDEVAISLDKITELSGLTAGDLIDLLNYALSLLSDVKRVRSRVDLDKEALLFENISLKSKIISFLCQRVGS